MAKIEKPAAMTDLEPILDFYDIAQVAPTTNSSTRLAVSAASSTTLVKSLSFGIASL